MSARDTPLRLPRRHAGALTAVLVVGIALAATLLVIKLRLLFEPEYASSCRLGAVLDCDAVQSSTYATVFGVPLAALGLGTYGFLLALTWLAHFSQSWGSVFLRVLAYSSFVICLHSVYLAWVSTFVIEAYCVYCIGMYAVNIAVAALARSALRTTSLSPAAGERGPWEGYAAPAAVSAGVFIALMATTLAAYHEVRERYQSERIASAREELTALVTGDGRAYFAVPVGEADFPFGAPEARVTVVEFGDFQCPYCAQYYRNTREVRERFATKVRWVFKHVPMDARCNANAKGAEVIHADSCAASRAANCAGEQGLFWPMHDLLFEHQHRLGKPHLRRYAENVGVDLERWDQCVARKEPDGRIATHTKQAARAGVVRTPTSYINGHLVPGVLSAEVMEYYLLAALENPWGQAAEIAPLSPAHAMIELSVAGNRFYVDAYEARIDPGDESGAALSQPGQVPSQASWFEADRACRAAGKRLCSASEWVAACAGNPVEREGRALQREFPYGHFYWAGLCNDNAPRPGPPVRPTGDMPRCRTPEGIYDLSGNLAEWTGRSASDAALMPSHARSALASSCWQPPVRRGEPGFKSPRSGFRCCSDTR